VPGRLEIVRENPRVVLDVCNNPDGAAHLARALKPLIGGGKLILVLGILADKDFDAMVGHLAPLAHTTIATQPQSPRAAAAEIIAWSARAHCKRVEIVTPVEAAVQRAFALASPSDSICVAGSFTTVGEINRGVLINSPTNSAG
jgi:dihydrofolate synthase/folylpolyglutamate synthase